MTYEKLLNEIYAALSLKYLWREYRPGFVKSESPDWINETMDMGLEVSQALLPGDGQEASFIEKYLGCLKEELPATAFERYRGRLHFYNGRFWALLPDPGKRQDYIYKAQYRFSRKLEKLNSHYQNKKCNGLYLFVHPAEGDRVDSSRLFAGMRREQADRRVRFDRVFLHCKNVIYVCNYSENKLETIEMTRESEGLVRAQAERLRQSVEWENGTAMEKQEGLSGLEAPEGDSYLRDRRGKVPG